MPEGLKIETSYFLITFSHNWGILLIQTNSFFFSMASSALSMFYFGLFLIVINAVMLLLTGTRSTMRTSCRQPWSMPGFSPAFASASRI